MRTPLTVVVLLLTCACGGTGQRSITSPSPTSVATPTAAFVAAPATALPIVLDGQSRTIAYPSAIVGAAAVPAAPTLQVPVVSGVSVTITWSPASTGDPASSFVLYYSLPQGGGGSVETAETSLSATAPMAGEFSIYVCGKNAAGLGPCSATQVFRIVGSAPTARPNPVRNLRVAVSGTTVTLTWDAPVGATPDFTYVIVVPNVGTFDAGPLTTASGAVGQGRYTATVYAKNAAGNGDPSNQVEFTVGGGCELPGLPRQLAATVPNGPGGFSGNRATISWSAPPGGGTEPTGTGFDYLVDLSGPVTGSLTTFNTFTSTGELPAGRYTVTVRTRSSCGTGAAATTTFTIETTQPTGGGATTFTGTFSGTGTVTDGNNCTYQVAYQGSATMTLTQDTTGLNWGGTLRLVGTYNPGQNICFVSPGSYDNTGAVGNTAQGAGTLRSDSIVVGPAGARFEGNVPSGTSVTGTLSITPGGGTGALTIPLTLTR